MPTRRRKFLHYYKIIMNTAHDYAESGGSLRVEQDLRFASSSIEQGKNPKTKKIRFYKFVDNKGLQDILENKRIKATDLHRSNDPMECLPAFRDSNEKADYYRNLGGWDGLQAICLTTRMSNGNMWARYADNHKGACLAFDIDLEANLTEQSERLKLEKDFCQYPVKLIEPKPTLPFSKYEAFMFRVSYLKNRVEIPKTTLKDDSEGIYRFLYRLLCTKDHSWSYENEYRLIYHSSELFKVHDVYYSYALFFRLKGIILGLQNCLSEKWIKGKLGQKASSVSICKAAISLDKFLITACGHQDTDKEDLLRW